MQKHIFTSYFYNIRFFKPYQVPISTAMWDPRWYFNFKKQGHLFLDKRGVLNGLRAETLHPDHTCDNLCRGPEFCETKDPSTCRFLDAYRKQLDHIDKPKFFERLESLRLKLQAKLHLDKLPDLIFIVHEPPYKTCSERSCLQAFLGCTELVINKSKKASRQDKEVLDIVQPSNLFTIKD